MDLIDIQAICDAASHRDVKSVCDYLLRNPCNSNDEKSKHDSASSPLTPKTPSLSSSARNAATVAEALFDFFFHNFLGLPSLHSSYSLSENEKKSNRILDVENDSEDINKYLMRKYNCALLKHHVIHDHPDLILRAFLIIPPWHNIPWNASVTIIKAIHSGRIINKNAFSFISELRLFLTSTLNKIQDEVSQNVTHAQISPPFSSASTLSKTKIKHILDRLFSLTFVIISPFMRNHEAFFNHMRNVDVDKEVVLELKQNHSLYKVCDNQSDFGENRHLILPFDLLTDLLPIFKHIQQLYYEILEASSSNVKEPCGEALNLKMNPFNCILSTIFHPISNEKNNDEISHGLIHTISNIRQSMLPSLLIVATDCAKILEARHWISLYFIVSSSLHHEEFDATQTSAYIIPSDYAGMIRQCMIMLSIVSDMIRIQTESKSTDIDIYKTNETDSKISFRYLWESLIFEMYHGAAICWKEGTLATVETVFRSSLAQLTPPRIISRLIGFTEYFISTTQINANDCLDCNTFELLHHHSVTKIPRWVFANVLLLLLRSQKGPRMVFRLAATVMGIDENTVDPVSRICTLIVQLATHDTWNKDFGDIQHKRMKKNRANKKRKFKDTCNQWGMFRLAYEMRKLYYVGGISLHKSCFKKVSDENRHHPTETTNNYFETASACMKFVYYSLSLGRIHDHEKESTDIYSSFYDSSEIGAAWTHASFSMLLQEGNELSMNTVLLAIMSLLCVFWNIPASRQSIVRCVVLRLVNNSTGKNRNKYCFCIFCQILVSSIVQTQRVQSFSESQTENLSYHSLGSSLRPIYDLLASTSSIILSPLIHRQLLQAFLPLSFAREGIFSMCQKNLTLPVADVQLKFQVRREFSAGLANKRVLALEGICCLIGVISSDFSSKELDEFGNDALLLIRGFISTGKPHMSCLASNYLLQKLARMADKNLHSTYFLSTQTCRLLLRSCICSLLRLFVLEGATEDEEHSLFHKNNFTNENVLISYFKEKMHGSLRFVHQRLFVDQRKISCSEKRGYIICEEIMNLINLTLLLHRRIHDDLKPIIEDEVLTPHQTLLFNICENASISNFELIEPDSKSNDILDMICTSCISKILLFTIEAESQRQLSINHEKSVVTKECDQIQEFLLNDENNTYSVHGNDICRSGQKRNLFEHVDSNAVIDTKMTHELRSFLGTIFRKVIFSTIREDNVQFKKNRAGWNQFSMFFLLFYRNHALDRGLTEKNITQEVAVKHIYDGNLRNDEFVVAISFINALSKATTCTGNYDSHSKSVEINSNFLEALVHNCEVLIKNIDAINKQDGVQLSNLLDGDLFSFYSLSVQKDLIEGLWKLYSLTCCEDGARNIIQSIEAGISVDELASQGSKDFTVRKLRYQMLKALQNTMALNIQQRSSLHQKLFKMPLNRASSDSLVYHSYFKMMHKLVSDLNSGLEGRSGAITSTLFMMYLHTIRESITLASLVLEEINNDWDDITIALNIQSCEEISLILWRMFCKYSLKQSLLIKSALDISFNTVPLLSQRLRRKTGVGGDENKTEQSSYIAVKAAIECLDILKAWYILKTKNEKIWTWNEIIDHVINTPEVIQSQYVESDERAKMKTPQVWSWTLNSALQAMEQNWMESSMVIQKKNRTKDTPHLLSESYLTRFCAGRRNELTSIVDSVVGFLGYVESIPRQNSNAESSPEVMYAELLSDSGKVRLCKCLDRISTTMNTACQCILKSIKETVPSEKFTVSLLESLICLGALFQSTETFTRQNIASGTRLWYFVEKLKFSRARENTNTREYHMKDNPVLSRLPSVIFRTEAYEAALQSLLNLVICQDSSQLGEYDVLLSIVMGIEPVEGALLNLLQAYITKSLSFESHGIALILDMEKCSQIGTSNYDSRPIPDSNAKIRMKRKRKTNKPLHGKQRQILRSRNITVDKWLGLDRDISDDDDEEDAFVDLEDFLEEG